ncbi:MAG TPA: 2-amino-4-hydroxy-6-hydroxymethyldihydropteridine diphosphokinase, partial [Spirochaetales bacterium]|nr:2-amino-4-hydroxy-6-hydroxymethyldihydropteridine diphosphokinase [Spirochaetales bacterium]
MSLGSNTGDSMTLLASAVHELSGILDSLRVSPIYRSSPRYVLDQPDFLNLVVGGDTDLAPDELLDATQAIEAAHGRD